MGSKEETAEALFLSALPRTGLARWDHQNEKKKFRCINHPTPNYFNEDTCWEAICFWKKMAKKILNQFLRCNSTYKMLQDALGAPIAFIRQIIHRAGKKVEQFCPSTLQSEKAVTVIFIDESTTGISQNWIYLSFVEDKVYWEINLNRKKENVRIFLTNLQKELKYNGALIFVTDGYIAYVDLIAELFPTAIHIRQFHAKRSLGYVHIHYTHNGERYTCRTTWRVVLSQGKPSKRTIQQRKRRKKVATGEVKKQGRPKKRKKLDPQSYFYKGVKYYPLKRKTKKQPIHGKTKQKSKSPKKKHPAASKGKITPPKLLAKGPLKTLCKRFPPLNKTVKLVSQVFGGRFITNNNAENKFKVKDWLKVHKSVKNNSVGIINLVLFGYFYFRALTPWKKEEVVKKLL